MKLTRTLSKNDEEFDIILSNKWSNLQHAFKDGTLEEVKLRHLGAVDGSTVIVKNVRQKFRSFKTQGIRGFVHRSFGLGTHNSVSAKHKAEEHHVDRVGGALNWDHVKFKNEIGIVTIQCQKRTPHVVEQVNIGSGPLGSKVRWFRSTNNEPRFINTVTFDTVKPDTPTIVLVHGYGASQGFFLRKFDALASKFRVIAIDQIGWGASSRPDFTCKSTEEAESWFIDSLEEWRKVKNLDDFILLGHSLGGYVAARYALKYPEHVKHLVLVGPAGFNAGSDRLMEFKSTWKGAVANFIWESNFTPQSVVRGLGPWGPNLVNKYAGARFGGKYGSGATLTADESKLLSDYMFHTLAAKASGELCLKYIFSLGALARTPLVDSAPDWKVPTSFIYGFEDWMHYTGAIAARERMKVPCEILRVPQGGHFVFLDNAPKFHESLFYACRQYLPGGSEFELPKEILKV